VKYSFGGAATWPKARGGRASPTCANMITKERARFQVNSGTAQDDVDLPTPTPSPTAS
jgi:hypothetical protein